MFHPDVSAYHEAPAKTDDTSGPQIFYCVLSSAGPSSASVKRIASSVQVHLEAVLEVVASLQKHQGDQLVGAGI